MQENQLTILHKEYDSLQNVYGDTSLSSIYGAGSIKSPSLVLVFMNPTGRNISAFPTWNGIRAPWLGTKHVWDMLTKLRLFSPELNTRIQSIKPEQWDESFANDVYADVASRSIYITNLAKCTQIDARPLPNRTFIQYRELMLKELSILQPKMVVPFGNQVSSILLGKQVRVSSYKDTEIEQMSDAGKTFQIAPTYYPVGQGRRNMPRAIARIDALKQIIR